jgi:hypothetical protein
MGRGLDTAIHSACNSCCDCENDQLLLTEMWDCTYLNIAQTFLNNSYYGEKCLPETLNKLHLFNAMFWLFQTNSAPEFTLNNYKAANCSSLLHDTFAHTVCTDITCELLQKFNDMIGSCCVLQKGEKFSYCQLASKGDWESYYNSGAGYQINDIIAYGNIYWKNTIPNNLLPPSNNEITNGWTNCVDDV